MREQEIVEFARTVAEDMGLTNVQIEILPFAMLSKTNLFGGEVIWGVADKTDGGIITICAPEGRSISEIFKTVVHELAHLSSDMSHSRRWEETYNYYVYKYGLVAGSREVLLIGIGAVVALGAIAFFALRTRGKL